MKKGFYFMDISEKMRKNIGNSSGHQRNGKSDYANLFAIG